MNLLELFGQYPSISTDTRKIEPNSIFFALKGANFNGNEFAKEALAKGAAYAVIDEPCYRLDERYILVENTLESLQMLARRYRATLTIPVIAIGGSNGKTTTKELICKVLQKKYKVFATQGNLNNHIGVPLSLLSLPRDTQIAVIELGANHIHETAFLCEIAQPNSGVVTNIGLDHLEGFGSFEGVMQANNELYIYLEKNQGKIFLNTHEIPLVNLLAGFPKEHLFTYPQKNDYFGVQLLESDFYIKYQSESGQIVQTELVGKYNFANIATALCVGKYFEVPETQANEAVSKYEASNNRSQVIKKDTNHIVLDAYNANPSSMKEAIESFASIGTEKQKIVVLGQMSEMGAFSPEEHQKLGQLLASKHFEAIVLYGQEMKHALPFLPKAFYFEDKFSLHNWLQSKQFQHSLFLIKGSRAPKMETVLDFL